MIGLYAHPILKERDKLGPNVPVEARKKVPPVVWTAETTCLSKDRLHVLTLLKSQVDCEIKVAIFNLFQVKRAKFLISCFVAQICPDRVSISFKELTKEYSSSNKWWMDKAL